VAPAARPPDIAIAAREILRWRKTLNEAIAKHTGKPVDQIEKDSDRDYYLSAPEAKDYGIVDHVVSSTAGGSVCGANGGLSARPRFSAGAELLRPFFFIDFPALAVRQVQPCNGSARISR
jgi:hypothetical protein